MLPKWQTGIVKEVLQLTENVRHYWIQLPEVTDFHFLPGQFVTFDLPIHALRNKRWRSYSIAAMPNGTNVIELSIAYVQGGLASEYIFNQVSVGSEILLRGPHGVFLLPEIAERDLFMICTGTGIAPFRSMLQYIAASYPEHRQIHLIFGTRRRQDILFGDEMKAYESQIPNFHYHPTLSREQWDGLQGHVHPVYEELCLKRPAAMFMLCGQKNMIDEAKARILAMGYHSKDIMVEIYG